MQYEYEYNPTGDEADLANNEILMSQEMQINQIRQNNSPERQPNYNEFDGVHCVDCGDEIIPQRLKMKCIRCVICQEDLEKRQRQFAR